MSHLLTVDCATPRAEAISFWGLPCCDIATARSRRTRYVESFEPFFISYNNYSSPYFIRLLYNHLLIVSNDTVFLSDDNGRTWRGAEIPDTSDRVVTGFVTSTGRIYLSTREGTLYDFTLFTTSSIGEEWVVYEVDPGNEVRVSFFAESEYGELYAVDNASGIYRTEVVSSVESRSPGQRLQMPNLTISPNPVGESGVIDLHSAIQGDLVRITDLLGYEVMLQPISTAGTIHLDVSNLSPALYVVALLNEEEGRVDWNMMHVIR